LELRIIPLRVDLTFLSLHPHLREYGILLLSTHFIMLTPQHHLREHAMLSELRFLDMGIHQHLVEKGIILVVFSHLMLNDHVIE
jgi:hypothetical protein